MKNIGVSFISFVLLCGSVFTGECCAASPGDGAALYRKRCSACHPDASRVRSSENLVYLMRIPPGPMPAFGEDRLSNVDAQTIADFIRSAASGAGNARLPDAAPAGPPLVAAETVPVAPPVVVAETAPAAAAPARVNAKPEKPLAAIKPPKNKTKEKKSIVRNFVKNWSIKGLRNDEVITIQKFEIVANANNQLSVLPSTKLADYALKITAFEIIDNALKLQFTWTWRRAPSHRRIETYELALADDGTKLSGTYNLQTTSGTTVSLKVWGE